MGAVDLVVQVESPPSVASGLQRVGRAGHQVGAVSRGVLFPKFRGDLVQTAVVVERMRAGADRGPARARQPARRPRPAGGRDVRDGRVDRRRRARAGPPRGPVLHARPARARVGARHARGPLPQRRVRRAAGRASPGTASTDTLTGAAAPSGSRSPPAAPSPTAGSTPCSSPAARAPGRRVGELDEEMVYESRVGDVFTLGASSWRIEDITHDRVLVTPAPGPAGPAAVLEGRLPRPAGRAGPSRRRLRPRGRGARARMPRAPGSWPPASTSGPPTTCSGTCASSARPPATCPTTGRSSWSGSATSSATGGSSSTRRSAPRCTRPGRWPWRPAPRAVRRRRAGHARRRRHRAAPARPRDRRGRRGASGEWSRALDLVRSSPTTSEAWSPTRSAAPPCSPRASGSAPRGPCCCHGGAPTGGSRCGSSASGPPSCSRWPASTRRSRSSWRPCGSASRTSSTCPGSSTLMRDIALAQGHGRRGREQRRRRSPSRCSSATSPSSCTRATRRWPSAGPRRWPSTPACSPSCSARARAWRCATCSTPSRSPAPRPSCSASPPSGPPATPRTSPTCCAARPAAGRRILRALREGTTGADVEAWLAGLEGARRVIRVRMAGDERWAAIEDAGPAARRARAPAAPGVPETFLEPVPDPLGDLVARYARTHGPFHVAEVAARSASGPPWRRRPAPARGARPRRRGRAAAHRRRRAPSTATRRCCGCCAAARSPRCAPRSSR